ncbi:hypothetical protein P22_1460 [Propionispora sp. 2/2-37]|uniref:macro domain-containing protein n=1 Tax=Propionispora sp. 2/2-37 TaxID=1677858 RepID=UPI0006BB58AB|nr:macro domain-containing protein [Propionispora sp. 2/2-37]CUH95390.1 hypothetical protein P22_1460 [Propionispora sp. 2/2-37]
MIKIGKKTIIIKQGDITAESTDAIVNPANSKLQHGGGAARAISVKGGAEIQKQSNDIIKKIGSVPVGKAVITDAGNLSCKFVIHTVGPRWGEGKEHEKLRKAIMSVLTLAELYNLKSVSIPAVSSGIFGFPKKDCAEILIKTAYRFLQQDEVGLEHIIMCNFDNETYQIFLQVGKKFSEELLEL